MVTSLLFEVRYPCFLASYLDIFVSKVYRNSDMVVSVFLFITNLVMIVGMIIMLVIARTG